MYVIDPLMCYLIGVGAIVVGIVLHTRKKKRLQSWLPAEATVQNLRRRDDGDTTATMRFVDGTGQLRTALMPVSDGDAVGLGSKVEIAYNPSNPEEAFVRSRKDMKLALYVPVGAGIALIALGILGHFTTGI